MQRKYGGLTAFVALSLLRVCPRCARSSTNSFLSTSGSPLNDALAPSGVAEQVPRRGQMRLQQHGRYARLSENCAHIRQVSKGT